MELLERICVGKYSCVAGGVVVGASSYFLWVKINSVLERRRILRLVQRKRVERAQVFKTMGLEFKLSPEMDSITQQPLEDLIGNLQSKRLSATKVLTSFIGKALEVNASLNCVTEFNPRAMQIAQSLDEMEGVKGPLHGVPLAVKENHDVAGMGTTSGYGKLLFTTAEKNSTFVQALEDLGAVPFCKTNVPQTLFTYASDNPIFGRTSNHLNSKLSPGGSSSGSAALVGGRGAPFATGSDIGGSLRIPAHFSGLASIKPTSNRLTNKKAPNARPAPVPIGVSGVPGLLTVDAKSSAFLFRLLTEGNLQNKIDPLMAPIPWNSEVFESKDPLRIGYFTSLPFFPAVGDTVEVVLKAKTALESLGHHLVPFTMPESFEFNGVMMDFLAAHFAFCFLPLLEGEEVAAAARDMTRFTGSLNWKRHLRAFSTRLPFLSSYSKRTGAFVKAGMRLQSPKQVWALLIRRAEIIQEILVKMEENRLDLILSPAFPFPAIRLGYESKLTMAVAYTMIWNLTDFPSGVIPFGLESGKNFGSYDTEGDAMLQLALESVRDSAGMPIGVQIVGKPYQEELILRAMVQLEDYRNSISS